MATEDTTPDSGQADAIVVSDPPTVKLNRGTPLDEQGAYLVCRSRPTTVIAMAGPIECGKTTLIASIHQGFQFGPVGNYCFKRSHTLVGFEEKCFESRAASGAIEPYMLRTSFSVGQQYFHLWLQHRNETRHQPQLLFLDMSGEYFERSLDFAEEARHLTALRRANFFVVLLDGRKLASKGAWQDARQNSVALVRRCVEENLLSPTCLVQIVVTKVDLLLAEKSDQLLAEAVGDVAVDYNRFSDLRIVVKGVAASPKPGSPWPLRFGVEDLLEAWASEATGRVADPTPILIDSPRVVDRMASWWLPEQYQ